MGVPYGDRGYPPPHGLAPLKPTVSPRGRRGAHPRLHLGVLALPGDGGHLTDFVANLWSIGALVTLYNTGEAQTMVLLTPGGPRCLSPQGVDVDSRVYFGFPLVHIYTRIVVPPILNLGL